MSGSSEASVVGRNTALMEEPEGGGADGPSGRGEGWWGEGPHQIAVAGSPRALTGRQLVLH